MSQESSLGKGASQAKDRASADNQPADSKPGESAEQNKD